MGFSFANPGCCCGCPECVIVDDQFDADTIANYTATGGSWTINDGAYLSQAYSANAGRLVHNTANGNGKNMVVTSGVSLTDYNDKAGVIAAYADADNYIYGLAYISNTDFKIYLEIWERVGGVNTKLAGPQDAGSGTVASPYFVCLEYYNGSITFSLKDLTGIDLNQAVVRATAGSPDDMGSKAGLIVDTVTSYDTFDFFTFRHFANNDCPTCGCDVCRPGTMPDSLQITFTNTDCSEWDPLVITLTRISGQLASTFECGYEYTEEPAFVTCLSYDVTGMRIIFRCLPDGYSVGQGPTKGITYEEFGGTAVDYYEISPGVPTCCKTDCSALIGTGFSFDLPSGRTVTVTIP